MGVAATYAASREGLGWRFGARVRTSNIRVMLVTPEVSQLEMSSLMLPRSRKSWLMSVIPETSKSAMGPYWSPAPNGLESHATSAVLSSALVAKTLASRRRPLVCKDHRQPLRRARDGVVGLRQLACHTGFGHVREEGGAKGGGDAEEDEHTEARGVLLRLGEGVGGGRGLG